MSTYRFVYRLELFFKRCSYSVEFLIQIMRRIICILENITYTFQNGGVDILNFVADIISAGNNRITHRIQRTHQICFCA